MLKLLQKLRPLILTLTIAAFLLGVSGVAHFGMSMKMDADGHMEMSDCYIPGMTAVCHMTPLQHVANWNALFVGVLTGSGTLLFLLLVLAILGGITWIKFALPPPKDRQKTFLYNRRRKHIPRHFALQELFSQGILNTKVF